VSHMSLTQSSTWSHVTHSVFYQVEGLAILYRIRASTTTNNINSTVKGSPTLARPFHWAWFH